MNFRRFPLYFVCIAILTSCGQVDETSEACQYEITQALDSAQYEKALDLLESTTCRDAYDNDTWYMDRAAAYMGLAGFTVSQIITDFSNVDSSANNSYQSLVQTFSGNASAESLGQLQWAGTDYGRVITNNSQNISDVCLNNSGLGSLQLDACFNFGLVETIRAAQALSVLLEGEVDDWLNPQGCAADSNGNGISDQSDAVACALKYAANGQTVCGDVSITTPTLGLLDFVTDSGQGQFEVIEVIVPAGTGCSVSNNYYKLIDRSVTPSSPVLTEGVCMAGTSSYQACDASAVGVGGCYSCPIVDSNGQSSTVDEVIVDAINNGSDNILATLDPDAQADLQTTIDDFRTEVCGGDDCTQDELADYLAQ
ncbi:MAG: hypothetical protein BMS9Abin33_0578 [Gammaproteobacteria bacterium]|nr:MAG: hypothetical protein BMS9Abin33_0578 [Gammaproteobacteria bacterium]